MALKRKPPAGNVRRVAPIGNNLRYPVASKAVVIADIHRLTNSGEQFDLLVSIFQTGSMMPLLIIGEPSQMRHLLAMNERFLWRFPPLHLE